MEETISINEAPEKSIVNEAPEEINNESLEAFPILKEVLPIETQFNNLLQDLSNLKTHLSDMQTKVKLLEKSVARSNKEREKAKENEIKERKKEESKLQQHLSGFDKPVTISPEMCTFMNKPVGSIVARTYIVDYMLNYIRINKLQDMTNRKKINTDEILQQLLRLKSADEEITYFNLQKYLNIHII